MKILTPGYRYLLENFENPENGQTVQFLERTVVHPRSDDVSQTIFDGTTNEEMLKVLIDRICFLQERFPCRENAIVVTKLEEALMWLEKRTNDRKARGVLGKAVK